MAAEEARQEEEKKDVANEIVSKISNILGDKVKSLL